MNRMNLWAGFITGMLFVIGSICVSAQEMRYDSLQTGNPIIPGYFADPTVVKFGDTYYLYATTDGNGGGFGPSQVWVSKDFVHWTIMPMNWPETHWIWAPDVMEREGKYYMYYCQPCSIYCGVAETPRGPWTNILGEQEAILVPDRLEPMAITLDGQTFVDDDGAVYLYWGTWGIYPNHGCGVGKFNPDLKSFEKIGLIPNIQAKDFFEAPYVIKKDGIYYFTYSSGSCHDGTYRVQYAVSKDGPMGPFEFPDHNPILETNADGSVHGPGHHSIIQVDGEYYIVYHRHNNPHATRGMHRQIAVDKLIFSEDGRIEKVIPTHRGVGLLGKNTNPYPNLALGKQVRASSAYREEFKPEYAVDDNNGTLWRAAKSYGEEWIEIDLGKLESVRRIRTEFEYATSYYQYKIEVSKDGKIWNLFADKTRNTLAGSPMMDYGDVVARYVRLTITGNEKQGLIGAIWNIKIYSDYQEDPPQKWIDLHLSDEKMNIRNWENTQGMLGGVFTIERGTPVLQEVAGKEAVVLPAETTLVSSFILPDRVLEEKPWTVAYTAYGEPDGVLGMWSWLPEGEKRMKQKKIRGEKDWYQVAWVSDGKKVCGYLNQQLIITEKAQQKKKVDRFRICAGRQTVALTHLQVYNWKLELVEIKNMLTIGDTGIVRPARQPQGLIAHISADDYQVGTTLEKLNNKRNLKGEFEVDGGTLPVKLKQNRLAFVFDGKTAVRSAFHLPATIRDLGNYTIAAWVLNPEIEENECIVDLNSGEGELNKVVLGYGKSSSSGIACHYGSFEDISLEHLPEAGQWHHIVLTYDGYAETVYVDGKPLACKDFVLLLTPEGKIVVGKRSDGQWGFSGYLNDLKIYDYALGQDSITHGAAEISVNRILLGLNCGELKEGHLAGWQNEGQWGGIATEGAVVGEVKGKMALQSWTPAGCRIQGLRELKSSDKTFVVDFLVPAVYTHLVTLTGEALFFVEAIPQGIILRKGNTSQRIEIKEMRTGEWGELVLVSMEDQLKVYFNGVYKATLDKFSFPDQFTELTLLKNKQRSISALANLMVVEGNWSDKEISEYAQLVRKNNVDDLIAQVKAKALTENMVTLEIVPEGQKTEGLSYCFEKMVSGKIIHRSGWQNHAEYLDGECRPDCSYFYRVKVKDQYGNVRLLEDQVSVNTEKENFHCWSDDFEERQDYAKEGVGQIGWDGLAGKNVEECGVFSENGKLRIQSKDRQVQREEASAPFLYKKVKGDFIVQVKVDDVKGLAAKKGCSYNEAGVMMLKVTEQGMAEVHLSLFPMYPDKGNMWTSLSAHQRTQIGNATGWAPDPYLQMERRGEYIYLRTSKDGIHWLNMPDTPLYRPDLKGEVRVGLFQATYTEEEGYGDFDEFRLVLPVIPGSSLR